MPKVLILGGTQEARVLATTLGACAGWDVLTSLAGVTDNPKLVGNVRSGGFGGVDGLVAFLNDHRPDVLVDATHPYAITISQNAIQAAQISGIIFARLVRPAWVSNKTDHWTALTDLSDAVDILNQEYRRAFLAVGWRSMHAFKGLDIDFALIRSVDIHAPSDLPFACQESKIITTFPTSKMDEIVLLKDHQIEVIVCKNSGGVGSSEHKLAAARTLGLPVLMLERPKMTIDSDRIYTSTKEMLNWLQSSFGQREHNE